MSKTQRRDEPKKVEEKTETKKQTTFSVYVADITLTNAIVYYDKQNKQRKTMSLAYVDVPRYDKDKKQEECFAYECGEFLRKKLVTGKLVKFEIVTESHGEIKAVVPILGKENLIVSLLEKGYVVLRSNIKAPEVYTKAETKAKENKAGVHNEDCVKLSKKRPERPIMNEAESKALENKTVQGHIKRIEAPGVYHIETPDRMQFTVWLYAVNQMLGKGKEGRWIFDEDGEAAMEHCKKYFNKRDVTVEVKQAFKGKLYGVVKVDKKDIAEDLLKNGFVVCTKFEGIPESIKQPYEKAEKEAKKEKRARWTDFDQALEDKIIAEREERIRKLEERKKNCKVISGAEVRKIGKYIEVAKDGESYHVNLASVWFISRRDEKANDLVMFRIKECIRKQIVGKKFECKEAYREEVKYGEKVTEHVYYDVYAGGKNICVNLFKEGLITLVKERDEFKRSFDYDKFVELAKENHKYTEKQVKYIEKEEKQRNKDVYLGTTPTFIIEAVLTPVKFIVYNPEKDYRMRVFLSGCRIPRDDENKELQQFLNTAKKFIRQNTGMNEVTVDFQKYEKGEFYVDIYAKKFNVGEQLVENGYAMFLGKEAPNEKVEAMKEAGEKIYKWADVRKPRDEEAPKPAPKPKREAPKEIKFDETKKVFIAGYDGQHIYYYESADDMKFLEELENKMKGLKKGKINEAAGSMCIVDAKGKFYRAQIIDPVPKAFVVKCVDTGAVIVCGKNKLKPAPEEIVEFKAPKEIQQISLVGIKTPVRGKHEEFVTSIEAVSEFYGKEATLHIAKFGETSVAKVMVGDVCINTMLVAEGLAVLNKSFRDSSEWGVAMTMAQDAAREKHTNMWKYGEFIDDEEREQK